MLTVAHPPSLVVFLPPTSVVFLCDISPRDDSPPPLFTRTFTFPPESIPLFIVAKLNYRIFYCVAYTLVFLFVSGKSSCQVAPSWRKSHHDAHRDCRAATGLAPIVGHVCRRPRLVPHFLFARQRNRVRRILMHPPRFPINPPSKSK